MTNTTTIVDLKLAQRAAYILHLNTGSKAVPCTKLTETLLRAWDRADTGVRGCTQRQQRLMIEEARKVIRKLYNQSQPVEVCWTTHVDPVAACGVSIPDGGKVDSSEFNALTMMIGRTRVARARNRILDQLERDHATNWDSKQVVASDRMATLSLLLQQPQFRNSPVMHGAKAELRRASLQLERVRADRDGDPRTAAGALRRAINVANDTINAAREKPQQRQLRELQLGAEFQLCNADGTAPTDTVYTVHDARLIGGGLDRVAASFRQSDGYLAGPFRFDAFTYVFPVVGGK